ncbi:MAG: agmatine deiminase family protein [Bacteroidales bacterium]|jgi:agmatine/peptidylarginine deiminase|nr:agmatine deiminase family protein [Bacteroidales bacterium]
MKKSLSCSIFFIVIGLFVAGQPIFNSRGIELKHRLTAEEAVMYDYVTVTTEPTAPPTGSLRPIAEFEPAEAVLIAYPNTFGIPMSLIVEMAKDIKVITIVPNTNAKNSVLTQYTNAQVNTNNCEFLIQNLDSYWTRDYGPWFFAVDNAVVSMYDFTYNRPRPNDNRINNTLATYLEMSCYASTIQHCGGNFMNDGAFQAASTDLVLDENPSMSVSQIQQHFQEYMGITDYHFLLDPLQDYIKHIDCWGKFLGPDKVMIGQVPASSPKYQLYENVAHYFDTTLTAYGTPYRVYRIFSSGNNSVTAYTNSLILNNKIFVPVSGNSHDNEAIATYQAAMPGYQVFPISYSGWQNTDALHCRTHEIADRCMIYVSHLPVHGTFADTTTFTFEADIYSYCQNDLLADSIMVYVKDSTHNEFVPYLMSNTVANHWSASVGGLHSGTVQYYISAQDVTLKKECHPYIGSDDPHTFSLFSTDHEGIKPLQNPRGSLSVRPIPASDYVEIVTHDLLTSQASFYDISGKKLMEVELSNTITGIDISALPSGFYVVKVGNRTAKLIKTAK